MLGRIFIKDLVLRCTIGDSPEEQASKQEVITNVSIWTDFKKPTQTDSVADAVNYFEIYEKLLAIADKGEFELQESLAKKIAEACLEDKRVIKVKVSCEKPHIFKFVKSVGVELELQKA